ncbi:hypothetical protein C5F52_10895 [Limnohabitans sp. TS-CS-82]|uniref:hypothetical protein n=1 Tax=Limnohabitans sp. TS-CS-82 TaxID=2094193 RepID=UPI000CF24742|nr:hypothetical protein [Limnohabitans sp. TS-CS-82]PQA83202.1 hypothetical protein C5F52_10895 [Limnohabitans sp. TS-CS-82]
MDTKHPKWLQNSPYLADKNKDPAKFQSQIEQALRIDEAVKDQNMHSSFQWMWWSLAFKGAASPPPDYPAPDEYALMFFNWQQGGRRVQEITQMVALTADMQCNGDTIGEWWEQNRASLTANDFESIVMVAGMLRGKSEYMREVQSPRSERAQETNDQIETLWLALKAEGVSKNEAAKQIAPQVYQTERVVRGKLQKL